uniref:BZIP domain-containing protein n=1 Tax=Panagrellus redivivus TaxID=6233 RepID=A0A7E5A111_PANRE
MDNFDGTDISNYPEFSEFFCQDGQDWPDDSNFKIEEFLKDSPTNQEVYTPSTDSGNHSPTSSSSDGGGNQPLWPADQQAYADFDAFYNPDMPPVRADLEAIEALLDEGHNHNYGGSDYSEHSPSQQYSMPSSAEEGQSNQAQGQYSQQMFIYNVEPQGSNNNYIQQVPQQKPIQAPQSIKPTLLPAVRKAPQQQPQQVQRMQPYTIVRPTKAIKSEPIHYVHPTTTAASVAPAQTYILNTDGKLYPTVATPAGNTIYVPAPVRNVSLAPRPKDESRRKDEEFSRKCEDRKLRNRHAAQLSRERKKAEFENMRNVICQLENENTDLKRENLKLKSRVCELESRFGVAPTQSPSKVRYVKAVGASFMVMMLFMSLPGTIRDLTPTTIESSPGRLTRSIATLPNDTAIAKVGSRSLLAVEDYDAGPEFDAIPPPTARQPVNSTYRSCANGFLNTTQRIKVNNDLINWIDRHEKMNLVQLRNGKNPFLIYNSRKTLFPTMKTEDGPPLKANSTEIMNVSQFAQQRHEGRRYKDAPRQRTLVERAWQHIDMSKVYGPQPRNDTDRRVGGTELAIPTNIQEEIMKQLAAQLDQKDDMMYVMALKDYFILPRLTPTNSTEAPKLSIIVPALASTQSGHPNQIKMMRIECTVTSTSLFFLPDGLVSLFNGSAI